MNAFPAAIEVRGVVVGYGETVVQQNLNFQVRRGEVFVILGGSGSGKSSVLKAMIGLNEPLAGEILIDGEDLVHAEGEDRLRLLRKFGVMYQSGALFGSMTVLENVRMPLDEFSDLERDEKDLVALGKLNQVESPLRRGPDAVRAFRRHEEARGDRPRAGARSRHSVSRRALGRSGSDHVGGSRSDDSTIVARASASRSSS